MNLVKRERTRERDFFFTFKQERFIPVRVQVLSLHLGLKFVLLVWEQVDLNKGVRGSGEIFSR